MRRLQGKSAFTLVEMLVVIAIIAVMVTLPILAYNNFVRKARDGRRKQDMDKVMTALQQYRSEVGTYPIVNDWDDLKTALVPNLLANLPEDPTKDDPTFHYSYSSDAAGKTFTMSSILEEQEGGNHKVYVITPNGPNFITGTPPALPVCARKTRRYWQRLSTHLRDTLSPWTTVTFSDLRYVVLHQALLFSAPALL